MIGQVYKAHSNVYHVWDGKKLNRCVARGVLKLKNDGVLVGDFVEFDKGIISSVKDRKNRFIRPNVSNVDVIVAVISPQPKPDFLLLDKLLLSAIKEDTEFIIAVNKSDLSDNLYDIISSEYKEVDVEIVQVCAKTLLGINQLKYKLNNKLAVLAGQSAVGKTSLINAMYGLDLKTGELSEKIQRGKHTTTRSEIFQFEDVKIIDSPGFAVIDAMISVDELPECYPEYFRVSNECRFRGCKHVNEPECKVKEMVKNKIFSAERYERYVEIYNEISKRSKIYEKD